MITDNQARKLMKYLHQEETLGVAGAIFLSRQGEGKEQIKNFVEREFQYNLDRTPDEIRPDYDFDVSCQGSVPEAICCFLHSTDFEDAIRTAISIGGDSDTIAALPEVSPNPAMVFRLT